MKKSIKMTQFTFTDLLKRVYIFGTFCILEMDLFIAI